MAYNESFNDFKVKGFTNYLNNNNYKMNRQEVQNLDNKLKQDYINTNLGDLSNTKLSLGDNYIDNPNYTGVASDHISDSDAYLDYQVLQKPKIVQPAVKPQTNWNNIASNYMGNNANMDSVRKFQQWAMSRGEDVGGGGIADGKMGRKTLALWNKYRNVYNQKQPVSQPVTKPSNVFNYLQRQVDDTYNLFGFPSYNTVDSPNYLGNFK